MTTLQQRQAQMQSKLQEGLKMLAQASDEDGYRLGMALLKLHAALEDHFRIEIARKAPSLKMEVEDAKKTSWNELIRYGKQYLRLSENDARIIVEANRQRQSVAHGGNYEKSRRELVKYADFVERWCQDGKPSVFDFRSRTSPAAARPYRMAADRPLLSPRTSAARWYRSRSFFVLTFFLLPPLWSILTLSDRHQVALVRWIAGALLCLELFAAMIVIDPALNFIPGSLDFLEQQIGSSLPVMHPSPAPEADPRPSPSPAAREAIPAPGTSTAGAACTIVWVEQGSERLAGKNRSMVWAEVVLPQVQGSGMTARQFYDQVLERNPVLEQDGYEFKKGKTYLLPACG